MPIASALSYVRLRKPVLINQPATADAVRPDHAREHPRLLFWLLVVLLTTGILARLTRYVVMGAMWGDEAMLGLNIISRDFAGLTRMLDWMQTAPILFLWSERLMYLVLGSSELSLRLLPLLAGLGGLILFWDFARRAVPPLAAVLATGILSVANWPVYMSATFKPYASDLFFATLLLNLAQRWYTQPGRLWPLLALVISVPIAMSSSYTAVFVAGGVSLYLLPVVWQQRDRRVWLLFAAFNGFMILAFALNYWMHIHGQLAEQGRALEVFMKNYWRDGFPPADPVGFVRWFAMIHTGRMFAYPVGDSCGGSTLTFLLFLVGTVAAWRTGSRALLMLCLVPFGLNFMAAAMGKYPYGGCCRLSQHLAPAICLLVGVGVASIVDRYSRTPQGWARWVLVLGVIYVIIGVWQMGVFLASPNRDRMAAWSRQLKRELEKHLKPGDRVVMVSEEVYTDATTIWQIRRLGACLSWGIPADRAADAPRVWVLANNPMLIEPDYEESALATLRVGRVEVGRALYMIPREKELYCDWRFLMVCLAKPEFASDKPKFYITP